MYQDETPGWLVRLYHLPALRPWTVLLVSIAIGLLALLALLDPTGPPGSSTGPSLRLSVDSAIENLLPAGDAGRKQQDLMRRRFGDDEVVFVALSGAEIVSPALLKEIEDLALALRMLPGVRAVVSLADASIATPDGEAISIVTPRQLDLSTPEARLELLETLRQHPFYSRTVISDDGRAAGLIVSVQRPRNAAEAAAQGDRVARITALADASAARHPGLQARVTGTPVIEAATADALFRTLSHAVPAITLIMALVLGFAFLNLRALLLSLFTIGWSLVILLGAMALLHRPLNIVTAMVPPIVLIIGMTYAIHLLTEYQATQGSNPGSPAHYRRLLDSVGMPLLINGLSTSAGFLALVPNPLPAVREFALLSAFGSMVTVLLVLGMLPALLHLTRTRALPAPGGAMFKWMGKTIAGLSLNYRVLVLWLAVLLAVIMGYGATKIITGTDFVNDFRPEARVRQDYEAVNREFGGVNPVFISLRGPISDYFVRPEVLREVESLADWLADQPEVGKVTSLVDEVKLLNFTMHDGDPEHRGIPDTHRADETIKQILLFGGDELKQYVDPSYRNSRIIVRLNVQDSAQIDAFARRVQERLEQLPEGLRGQLTGVGVLATRVVEAISVGQWLNIGLALLVVYAILSLLFTSWRAGLITLFPSLLPLAIYYGFLGFFGITLNPTTSLISCIVLGIAADDSVRFFVGFNRRARESADELKAARESLRAFLRPMTLASLSLCLGFLTLITSDLRNHVQFGLLASLTLGIAWLANMTVTPALAARTRVVTLWDTLRLDLGESPHRSIPLFDGLSWRQARIFALMSEIHNVPASTRIITEGEQGGDIYLIIDGQVQVWIERDGRRVDLATMRRGHTLGEIGHFSQRRSANVDALGAVRMLRFNDGDLERMVRRYPRIAAIVLRNLNRIQAVRISNTNSKLH